VGPVSYRILPVVAGSVAAVGALGLAVALIVVVRDVPPAAVFMNVLLAAFAATMIRLGFIGVRYTSAVVRVRSVFRTRTLSWQDVGTVRRVREPETLDPVSMVMSTAVRGEKPEDLWTVMIRTRDGENVETPFGYIPGVRMSSQTPRRRPGLVLLQDYDFEAVLTVLQDALTASRQESNGC
jgi:hypothetical protein